MGRQKGFTVVELVVAIGLFGIIVPAVAIGLSNLAVIQNRARDLTLVNMLAQNKIETLRSAGYNSVTTGTTSFSGELPNVLSAPKSAQYVVTQPQTGIKQIDVTISYSEYGGAKTVSYRTLISELGVGQ